MHFTIVLKEESIEKKNFIKGRWMKAFLSLLNLSK